MRADQPSAESPPVRLLHAPEIGGSHREWDPLRAQLAAAGYRCLAPDLPGFGEEPVAARAYTADECVAAVSAWCREPCHLVARGHAVAYAAAVAAASPELVWSLTAINPLGIHPLAQRPERYAQYATAPPARAQYEALAAPDMLRDWLCSDVYGDAERVTEELVAGLHQRATRPGAEHVFGSLAAGFLARDLREDWALVSCPILLIWGEACDDPPLDDAEDYLMPLRRDAPVLRLGGRPVGIWKHSVTYKTFADCRQRPHLEAPDDVAEAVLRHLAWCSQRSS